MKHPRSRIQQRRAARHRRWNRMMWVRMRGAHTWATTEVFVARALLLGVLRS